ncbi:hypothetical protein KUCAC02_017321 [Chaenocephalus aceratus]|uniref:Uncharacterized protein n=1 Tax=Chaenocephalus aceratus TaxID=36190 RepID=A0ACB9W0K8_CHAAC|nr:hypothetical protein KUCAC02_017321 [Chaenocephalus aceratus]
MYDILMWIQDNYSDAESMEDNTSVEVLNAAKETLLQGLSEENQGLQLYVRNFWSQEKRLPTATLERMMAVLGSLYSCQIEKCFLSLATNLLLETTSQSPDFKRNMFEYPLSECTFQDFVIDSNWRFRSTSVSATQSGSIKGKVRATQTSLEFSQTQTAGRRTAYNWLTGSSVDTLADYTLGSESLSSLMVFDKKSERQAAARRPVGEGFGLRRLTASTDEVDSRTQAANEQRNNILRLRRRFLKDQEKVSLNFAQKEIRHQRQKKEDKADQRLRKEAQVTLYRNYRVGDFPDVQIPYSSLIAPLQALAQRDPILAKQLFSSLFAGILQEMENTQTKRGEREELKRSCACVQDMCHQHKELHQLDPAAIRSTCLDEPPAAVGHPAAGGELVAGRGGPRRAFCQAAPEDAKKSPQIPTNGSTLQGFTDPWRILMLCAASLVVKLGPSPSPVMHFKLKPTMTMQKLLSFTMGLSNTELWSDNEPTDSEKDFWEIAAMEAYSHLTEWKSPPVLLHCVHR